MDIQYDMLVEMGRVLGDTIMYGMLVDLGYVLGRLDTHSLRYLWEDWIDMKSV